MAALGGRLRYERESQIRRYLDPEERLEWSGGPRRGLVLGPIDVVLVPFSLMWGGSAIAWEASVLRSGAPTLFVLVGILFVAGGVYLMLGRFVVDARRRANTSYGLTNRRVIIVTGVFSKSIKSLPLGEISSITLDERADRSGTIFLAQPHPILLRYPGIRWPGTSQHQVPALQWIQDSKAVHDLLLEVRHAAT